ncbi:polysaccharide biosynthesis protein [Cellulomonas sp. S1-8]|uniref:polysaccharide biosynthesis protein n=1 Tax=Cellulomonas sp. S1-8 TaxID=2904790 RepID=UPI0022438842|nr:nucleoside-diphosphate sugar epimerase/dehydratase [Cellulomonas sp. S1-8]UZN04146.1 polysaccharide biosynthesis protein [Cellulomonas sp. S1-8]
MEQQKAARRRYEMNRWAWAAVDGTVWFGAVYIATWLRFDFAIDEFVGRVAVFAAVAVVLQIVVGAVVGPYAVGHVRGSFEESIDIARTVAVVTAVMVVWALLLDPILVPRSVPVIAGALALAAMFAARFLVRSLRTRRRGPDRAQRRVIVFGAGNAGHRLVREMSQDRDSGYYPVALLDDDRHKRRLPVEGLKVRGDRSLIAATAAETGADALVIAIPRADAALIRELSDIAAEAQLDVLTLPPLGDIIDGRISTKDLRDLDLQDLLGRRAIDMDTTAIADQISGRSVLVTGAGGSIGSELCRQIARFGPAKLYLLDRDESALQATQLSLTGEGLLDGDEVLLADIRDPEALREVFAAARPDIVFHAAALKHLPLLETFPLEAWKSNVVGTLNVLEAAAQVDVQTFVNISTDKAARPTSVLGYSKRVTERLTAHYATTQPGRYVSVRFGNVLGSRGSVVHVFRSQIESGGPVTVTHPDVVRYFMLIPEACQLVLEAASIGSDGEVLVLDMGEQVRIAEVAQTLIRMSGRRDVEIRYSGLRPGEKLGEELFSPSEDRRPTRNALVTTVDVPVLCPTEVVVQAHCDGLSARTWMNNHAQTPLRVKV